MKIACVILNYNDAVNTIKLARTVSGFKNIDYIIIVDNCSTDDSMERFQPYIGERIHCIRTEKNGGYGYGNNHGARYAFDVLGSDTVIISNPDVSFSENVVENMAEVFSVDELVGIVAPMQMDRTGKEVRMSAWKVPQNWSYIFSLGALTSKIVPNFSYAKKQLSGGSYVQVECVAGSLLMISKEAFKATGGYDEDMFLYCEETTLGCKMQRCRFKTFLCTDVSYQHLHGISVNKSIKSSVKKIEIMLNSHHLVLKRYLNAGKVELAVDQIMCKICWLEAWIKAFALRILKKDDL